MPEVSAAIHSEYNGSDRTTLLIRNLPSGDAGTVEVFANKSCGDGEAENVLGVVKTKRPDETARIVQLIDRQGVDNFTVTYTSADGSTSMLSPCESIKTYPDTDGDGSVDPFDDLIGASQDSTRSVVVTDNEQVLSLGVAPFDPATGIGGGHLTDAGAVDTPGGVPSGVSLPYGAIGFTVEGLDPGASTIVSLVTLQGSAPIEGDSYWKYGPETKGGTPHWYEFSFDQKTQTGAALGEVQDIPGFGFRRAYNLLLKDGGRGDTNGFTDGRIVDPGGPAVTAAVDPTDPTVTTVPTDAGAGATPGAGASAPVDGGVEAAAPVTTSTGSLPYTGGNVGGLLGLGALMLLVGGAATLAASQLRRRTGRHSHGT